MEDGGKNGRSKDERNFKKIYRRKCRQEKCSWKNQRRDRRGQIGRWDRPGCGGAGRARLSGACLGGGAWLRAPTPLGRAAGAGLPVRYAAGSLRKSGAADASGPLPSPSPSSPRLSEICDCFVLIRVKSVQKMADPWQECMDYAVTLARRAGEVVRDALKNEMNVMIKSSPADLVTSTDQKVEKMLISSIKEKYPSHSFIGEESVAAGEKSVLTDNPTWIIDPIDGTTNFVHRFPFVAVSIGFLVNKKMEFGVVYSCVEDKMYTGRKGKGAFCNGQKLQVSRQEDITKSLLVTELGSSRTPETVRIVLSNMEKLLCIPIHGIRGVGTAAVNMCLVAAGVADAYYEMGIHCWDMAGAGIIVTEAGGVLMDVTGGPFDLMSRRIIAASSKTLAERIAKEIQILPFQRDDED
ncbi:inositol monophosphatase 1 isoform X1 [Equus quagga]|nr:inositol monophosphatase 1 isoform X1 [Equus quagga]